MLIDGAIEIKPFSVDPDIDFIELPWGVGIRKLISFQFLTRYRCIFNKLTVNGRAINGNPTLWQHIADIGITHRGQNVPTWNHLGPCGFTEEGMNSLSFHDNSIFATSPNIVMLKWHKRWIPRKSTPWRFQKGYWIRPNSILTPSAVIHWTVPIPIPIIKQTNIEGC